MTNKTGAGEPDELNGGIGQRLHETSERFVEMKDDVVNNLGRRIDSLGTLMKHHPLAALGIGLGIGYLVARILHR